MNEEEKHALKRANTRPVNYVKSETIMESYLQCIKIHFNQSIIHCLHTVLSFLSLDYQSAHTMGIIASIVFDSPSGKHQNAARTHLYTIPTAMYETLMWAPYFVDSIKVFEPEPIEHFKSNRSPSGYVQDMKFASFHDLVHHNLSLYLAGPLHNNGISTIQLDLSSFTRTLLSSLMPYHKNMDFNPH